MQDSEVANIEESFDVLLPRQQCANWTAQQLAEAETGFGLVRSVAQEIIDRFPCH